MPRRWIRLDVEWEESDWLAELDPAVRACWPRLLCKVKRDGVRGRCRRPSDSWLMKRWGATPEMMQALERAAISDEAIRIVGGDWIVLNWQKYQQLDPTAAERQRRHREQDVTDVTRDIPVSQRDLSRATKTVRKTDKQKTDQQTLVQPDAEPMDFERLWQNRPRREGADPKKAAQKAWNARRREGITAATMIEAHARYGLWCKAKKKVGTEHVMRASTFLGDPSNFENPWSPNGVAPANGARPDSRKTPQQFDYSKPTEQFEGFGP